MGDKNVLVDKQSNIYAGDVKYEYTPGLWKLMMKTPPVESYTNGDLLNYRRLVLQTNVMTYLRNVIQGQSYVQMAKYTSSTATATARSKKLE